MSTLSIKNKLLNEKLDEQDRTILALMNELTRYQAERFELKRQLRQCEVIVNNVVYDNKFHYPDCYELANTILNIVRGNKIK